VSVSKPESNLAGVALADRFGGGSLIDLDLSGMGAVGDAIPTRTRVSGEQEVWQRLVDEAQPLWLDVSCDEYRDGLKALGISRDHVPQLADLSRVLRQRVGWQVIKVGGFIDGGVFMECLAQKLFPCTDYLRPMHNLTYTPEPDMFHDIVGHLPMIAASQTFADFSAEFSRLYLVAVGSGDEALKEFALRAYWFCVEFGLRSDGRCYGAGIASSSAEMRRVNEGLKLGTLKMRPLTLQSILDARYEPTELQEEYLTIDHWSQLPSLLQMAATR
jgi:phenylalanine-4-hydroxylase